ncbi:MAG: hypothetical protein ACHQ9S_06300 [Candidatus Binatia bacterium]
MRVSGFSFVRNAIDLQYPVVEAITSVLPLCDEFIVVAGNSSDGTTELLRSIDSPKLQIVESVWDPALCVGGAIFAQQTNLALDRCSGDWAFYIQADEIVHERDLPIIEAQTRRYLNEPRVEALLFDYLHFFGSYGSVQTSHNWYAHEIRIVRTGIGVRSWHDAQGFRRDGQKLRVAHSGASIYHYGWVRSPRHLHRKGQAFTAVYAGPAAAGERAVQEDAPYPYGRLWGLKRFHGSHPAVMQERVRQQDWSVYRTHPAHKHDRIGIQVLSFVENNILGFRVGARRNYIALPDIAREQLLLAWPQRLRRYSG